MSDILIDCVDPLVMTKWPCKSEVYGYPIKFVVGHPDGVLLVVGDNPTVAELQTGLADAGVDKIILIEQITNGARVEQEKQEETGADTADGLTTTFGVNILTSGKVKLLDEVNRAELATLAVYQRLRTWVITSEGWILGGKNGYRTANYIAPMMLEGFGVRAAQEVQFIHKHDINATDPADQDDGYITITN